MTRRDFIKELLLGDQNEEVCGIYWTAEDVIGCAESEGIEITDEQVTGVLDSLTENFDANHGISWETIIDALP